MEVLNGPHLMLAHIGGHDGILGRQTPDGLQHLLGGKLISRFRHRGDPQRQDLLLPFRMAVLGQLGVEHLQHPPG